MSLDSLQLAIVQEIESLIQQDQLILPTLPEVALKARDVAMNPDVSARELADVVSNDPALTVRLIKVANSPLLRAQRQIDDLVQAIARMGIQSAANIISSLAMRQMFQASHPKIDQLMREIWSRSTEVAGIASVLCRHYTSLKPDQALLAGLVYQVGALPILSYAEDHEQLIDEGLIDQLVSVLHPRLGSLILRRWDFAPELVQVPGEYAQLDRQVAHADYVDLVTVAHLESLNGAHPEQGPAVDRVLAYQRLGLSSVRTEDEDIKDEMRATGQALQG